uniref:Uncharacterized protein n=1 Tax=Anguilla anguilla TaxID=7936 RepID=A0A0E9QTV1_ANGAN
MLNASGQEWGTRFKNTEETDLSLVVLRNHYKGQE